MIRYYWQQPHRVWAVACTRRFRLSYEHSAFTRALCLGPITVALTDLTWEVK